MQQAELLQRKSQLVLHTRAHVSDWTVECRLSYGLEDVFHLCMLTTGSY